MVFDKSWVCVLVGLEHSSVRCVQQSRVHTLSTHLLERRYEVLKGFLYFISDLIALKTWQYHKELQSQSSRVWPSMIVTKKKKKSWLSNHMTILMMDGWGGHTHLRDRNCVCSITLGGMLWSELAPWWWLFSIIFLLDQATDVQFSTCQTEQTKHPFTSFVITCIYFRGTNFAIHISVITSTFQLS